MNRPIPNEEAIVKEYRQILKEYSEGNTEDELILKYRKLNSEERAVLALYIACDYKITILARLLLTNTMYTKKMIVNIQNKIKEMTL